MTIAGAGPSGQDPSWGLTEGPNRITAEVTEPPRISVPQQFQSLGDLAKQAKEANAKAAATCSLCGVKERTIEAREAEIKKLQAEIEKLDERLLEQAQVLECRTSTADESRLMDRIRELQARDVTQRRDLDATYARLARAWQRLAAAGINLAEDGTELPIEPSNRAQEGGDHAWT